MNAYIPETQSYTMHENQLYRLEKAAHALRALHTLLIQSDTAAINALDLAAAVAYPAEDLAAVCQEIGGAA